MPKHTRPTLILFILMLFAGCSYVPRRVAIMDFENNTGDEMYDAMGSAMPEYLTLYLTNSRVILLLERQDIGRYLEEIDSDRADSRRLSRWQKLGKKIEAEYLIAGSVSRLDRNFILTARLFSVKRGEIVPGSAVTQICTTETEIYYRAQDMAVALANMLRPVTMAPIRTIPPYRGFSSAKALTLPVANP